MKTQELRTLVVDAESIETQPSWLIPKPVLIFTAFLGALIVGTAAALGPLGIGMIQYRTSQSGIWQAMGVDAVNLILIVPLLLLGGTLLTLRRDSAKYFLILTPVTLFSLALEAGAGQEWSLYPGNSERFAWLFIVEIIVALVLLIGTFPLFTRQDVPKFGRKGLRVYVGFMTILLVLFTAMWLQEIIQVSTTGNTGSGSYSNSPVAFWMVRFMDLGITIPLGFIGMYLLLTRPEKAYSLALLFFGFFVTMGTTVTSIGIFMALNHDPEAQAGALAIFPLLTIMSWSGLIYLIKDKLPLIGSSRGSLSKQTLIIRTN